MMSRDGSGIDHNLGNVAQRLHLLLAFLWVVLRSAAMAGDDTRVLCREPRGKGQRSS